MAALIGASDALEDLSPWSFAERASRVAELAPAVPVVEPIEQAQAFRAAMPKMPRLESTHAGDLAYFSLHGRPRRVDHRHWHDDVMEAQGSRRTCWAFAGVAALEAA